MRQYLNDNWLFRKEFSESAPEKELHADWETLPGIQRVRLPHTVAETPLHYFDASIYQMVSGYQRRIFAPKDWEGKNVLLTFEGAAHVCEVFLNGEKIGEHRCGYTAFTLDLSDKLLFDGYNLLVVRLDSRESRNVPPFGFVVDYMTYGGIYRDVYLEVREHVYPEDVFVYGEPVSGGGRIRAQVTLNNMPDGGCLLRNSIRKKGTEEYMLLGEQPVGELSTEWEEGRPVFRLEYVLDAAELWDTEHPTLYEWKTQLIQIACNRAKNTATLQPCEEGLGTPSEEQTVVFGFRSARFRADGFYLNGVKTKLRGLNRHQCYPYVGYAMPASMQKLDADILKRELGVNAVRTSHYPQSHDFLDRCDELGLLVFTEMPGWQYIGDEEWKAQAVVNTEDMVRQYRNHPSIILWGVRINESVDDDDFYEKTNEAAHRLDPYRATGGVRAIKRSRLLEDVYTYNDFLHDGRQKGCDRKKDVTSDMGKAYLISEFNGHMYPTKAFDDEAHRREHVLRHARVLDDVAAQEDIAGCFGWCMFDYNTHKDFGSGDRICYHGVLDMFRNPKPAAYLYSAQQETEPVLELTSSMDIGEHPGCNRDNIWILSNTDAVRMYKNGRFIKEYKPQDSPYRHLKHGPMLVDDFIGDAIEAGENFPKKQADKLREILNATGRFGLTYLPKKMYLIAAQLILRYHMKMDDAVALYTRYVGDWGGKSTSYRLEAVRGGEVVKTITKEPVSSLGLIAEVSHNVLTERHTYDVAAVRLRVVDQNGNALAFYNEPVQFETEGDIALIGPALTCFQGGFCGTYVKSLGKAGSGVLRIRTTQAGSAEYRFSVETE